MKNLIMVSALLIFTAACSNQQRSVPVDDWAFVQASLEEVTVSSSTNEVAQFKQLAALSGASVYYSDSPGYGPPISVASLDSFSFMGRSDLWGGNISEVRVFFVDAFTQEGRKSGLLISIKPLNSEEFITKAFIGTRSAEVAGEEYVTVLGAGGVEALTLRTVNVDTDGELEGVIKLDVSDFSDGGLETYIGQFSTLVGYQSF